jgi:O-methyltransferase
MKFTIIRFLKSTFIKLRLHVLFSPFTGVFMQLAYMTKLSKWASQNRKVPFNDFYSKWDYNKRYKLYQHIIEQEGLNEINYLEFGVADGFSFTWWMTKNTNPLSRFYGFDTFTGLPEDFGPYKKGTFNSGSIPAIKDERGKFYQGLFQQTLPGFLKDFDNTKRKVIMLDADLYTATLYTLTSLAPYLRKGDIIFFDEFVVPTHEFLAYQNFIDSYYFNLELIAAANNYYFVAFKVV